MPDLHYEHPALADIYDLDSGWSVDRDFYLALASGGPKRILDLGCGTGLLCDAYASLGHDVTGVDPAKAMLDVAKTRPSGLAVTWIEAPAQTFRTDGRFDLIVMTGHAFQVFLEDTDVLAVLATMRRHLAEGGIIAFETRNPAVDWRTRWEGDEELRSGDQPIRLSRIVAKKDTDNRISFDTHYQFPEKTLTSSSELLFLTRAEIEERLRRCGLKATAVFGDWDRQPFNEGDSDEMIFIVEAV
jgi:SAM-dependent methyltransferase